jgi:hypothetical protein
MRNDSLFRMGCVIAHDLGGAEELLTSLLSLNSEFGTPLDRKEVCQIASSVWGYKQRGTLWKKGRDATIVMPVTREAGGAIFRKLGRVASKLYLTLLGTRHTQAISDAIKELKQCGLIIDEGKRRGGSSNRRAAKLYKFGSGEPPNTV